MQVSLRNCLKICLESEVRKTDSNNNSVGLISLDLVIKENLNQELEKIKQRVSKPAENIGEAIEEAIETPVKSTADAVRKTVSDSMEKAAESIRETLGEAAESTAEAMKEAFEDNGIDDAIRRWQEAQDKKIELEAEIEPPKPVKVDPKSFGYDEEAVRFVEEYEQKMNEAVAETNERLKEGFESFEASSDPAERLEESIRNAYDKLALLQKKWQELNESEPTDKVMAQMVSVEKQIISTTDSISKMEKKLAEAGSEEPKTSFFSKLKEKAESTSSGIRKHLGNAFKSVKSTGGKALDSLKSKFKGVGKDATGLVKPVTKLGKTLKNAFRRVFVTAGIYAGFRALKEGLLEAAKADDEFAKSLSRTKANLAIAFTPVLQTIMPTLNSLMSGIADVTRSTAAFISGLFGTTYKQAAEATKKLKGVSDTAKKAKMSAAGIDEMNILSGSDSENESGTDLSSIDMSEPELPDWAERLKNSIMTGDWSGVGRILAERVNAVFGAVDWDGAADKLSGGVRKITDLINGFTDAVDWNVLGDAVAGGLNIIISVWNAFFDGINWDKLGSGAAAGLNRAVNKIKWKELGKACSAKLRALIDILYAFVTGFDWKEFGTSIGEAVNGWFDNIDFDKAGKTLSEGIKGITDAAVKFITTVNFSSIGSKIAGFLNNIDFTGIFSRAAALFSAALIGFCDLIISFVENTDWSSLASQLFDGIAALLGGIDWGGLFSRAFELIGAALGGTASFIATLLQKLWGTVADAYNSVKGYFSDKIRECGGNIIAGVFAGIGEALVNVGKWIKDHIFKPFIEGFKNAFGIHSPSKEMGIMGGYIIDGLFNAISDGIKRIKDIFSKMLEAIKSIFEKIDEWFSDKFGSAWEKIKSIFSGIGSWFRERWNDITSVFSAVGNWFSDRFTEAWNGIKNAFSSVKTWFSARWNDIKDIFSAVGEWFGEKFGAAWDKLKAIFSPANIISLFGGAWDKIKSIFSSVNTWFRDMFSSAFDSITGAFSGIGDFFSGIWEDIANSTKDGVNWVLEKINGLIELLESGINSIIDGLNSALSIDIPDKVPVIGGTEFSLDLPNVSMPKVPYLASGGLATAPTLAMVGDNRNARTDPEVIAPLSKLGEMLGSNSEVIELLKIIIELLRSGMSVEIINYLFKGSREFSREVVRAVAEETSRRGG